MNRFKRQRALEKRVSPEQRIVDAGVLSAISSGQLTLKPTIDDTIRRTSILPVSEQPSTLEAVSDSVSAALNHGDARLSVA